ncbi:MAG: hypothetical protein DMF69_05925 [Acidobacteria bacterium]|nr:MAG: hypothetical protein DMF69_05925 [Acidobacteriota bacterium]
MRYLSLIILIAFAASVSLAQTQTPAVEVVKSSWNKERIGWENDPFRGPIENFDEMRARTRNEKRITDAKLGSGGSADKVKVDAAADAANIATQHQQTTSRYVFMYKTTIRNLSEKTILSVDWDYVFLDKMDNTELNRHQFTSDEKIGPGKAKELVVNLRRPPTQTISVTSLNKNEAESVLGQVVVMRVQYSDGSSWQAPETSPPNP